MDVKNTLIADISDLLQNAQAKAYNSINFIMVETYWKIGRRIVEEEQAGKEKAEYGKYLIKKLSEELSTEFGKSVSIPNLKNFRQFYLAFPTFEIGYTVRSQLSWSHYRAIMRVDNVSARSYYMQEAAEQNWSSQRATTQLLELFSVQRKMI